jgi:hypothetical protein
MAVSKAPTARPPKAPARATKAPTARPTKTPPRKRRVPTALEAAKTERAMPAIGAGFRRPERGPTESVQSGTQRKRPKP